jgi:hypothetical protein
MQIRRGCLLPHRMCCRYVKQPNRRPRSQRAALPRSRRKRQRSKRRGQLLAGRVPSESSNQIRSGAATLRPGHTVLAPGSDPRFPRLCVGRQTITSACDGAGESRSCHSDPARSYASTNCRSNQATYPAICGKRATLRGDVDRADRKSRRRWNRPSASMLSGQVFGRGHDRNTTPEYWIDGRCIRTHSDGVIPGPVRRSWSLLVVSLRSTHSAAQIGHAWDAGRG